MIYLGKQTVYIWKECVFYCYWEEYSINASYNKFVNNVVWVFYILPDFRLHILSITKRGMVKYPTWIWIFPSLCLLVTAHGFKIPLLCACTFGTISFSRQIYSTSFIITKCPSSSLERFISLMPILTGIGIAPLVFWVNVCIVYIFTCLCLLLCMCTL